MVGIRLEDAVGTFVYLASSSDIRTGQTRHSPKYDLKAQLHVWPFVRDRTFSLFDGLTETPETAFVADTFGELVVLFLAVCQLEVGCVSTTQAPPSQCLPHMRVTPVRGLTSICLLTMAE